MVKRTVKEFQGNQAEEPKDPGQWAGEFDTGDLPPADDDPADIAVVASMGNGLDDRPAILTQKTLTLAPPQNMEDAWQLAPNVHETAMALIEAHDLEARHARIACMWRAKGGKSRGKNNMGGVQFLRGAAKLLARVDVVVWVAADHHENLAKEQIEASILNQLLRIREDEDGEIKQRYPDFDGFLEELDISGVYSYELAKAKAAFEQAFIPEFTVG